MRCVDVLTGVAVIAVLLPLFVSCISGLVTLWPCIPAAVMVVLTLYLFRK